jgi:flagellin-specific chaperone FliS
MSLYNFVYFRLVNANVHKNKELIDEAVRILAHLRETWTLAVDKDRKEKFPQIALVEQAQQQQSGPPPKPPAGGLNIQG